MAYAVSLAELRLGAQQLADMEGSAFVSTAEWTAYANRWIAKLYDELILASPDYVAAETTVPVTAGTSLYSLPADFRSLKAVLVMDGERSRPLHPLGALERGMARVPQVAASLLVEYLSAPPRLTSDADTFDVISGWDQFLMAGMARDALAKEESDFSAAQLIIDTEYVRIRGASSNRDRGQPKTIGMVEQDCGAPWWRDTVGFTLRYRLRGGNLEIFSL